MKKKEYYRILELMLGEMPNLARQIRDMAIFGYDDEKEQMCSDFLERFLDANPVLKQLFRKYRDQSTDHTGGDQITAGTVFKVHEPFSSAIRRRMDLLEDNEHYASWIHAMRSVPEYTLPLPELDGSFIRRARETWKENIYGNEPVLQAMLRHAAEYCRSGHTTPILLTGDPGIGKTLAARNYARILNLPWTFLSGPSAASGRGLSGAPNLYIGAGVGAIAQAMIDHAAGNPVICIDEIDKTIPRLENTVPLQDELLSALDESGKEWRDNYLEIELDTSHIPFVFTANDPGQLSEPLLDRIEVIRMESPDKEMICHIIREFTLPRVMEQYDGNRVSFPGELADCMVNELWEIGIRSCRPYQRIVETVASEAYLAALEEEHPVTVTETHIKAAASQIGSGKPGKVIGFADRRTRI